MTKLLDDAIEKFRALPEADQDEAAEILLSLLARQGEPVHLDDATRAVIREAKGQAGRGEFTSDDDMAALFSRGRK